MFCFKVFKYQFLQALSGDYSIVQQLPDWGIWKPATTELQSCQEISVVGEAAVVVSGPSFFDFIRRPKHLQRNSVWGLSYSLKTLIAGNLNWFPTVLALTSPPLIYGESDSSFYERAKLNMSPFFWHIFGIFHSICWIQDCRKDNFQKVSVQPLFWLLKGLSSSIASPSFGSPNMLIFE